MIFRQFFRREIPTDVVELHDLLLEIAHIVLRRIDLNDLFMVQLRVSYAAGGIVNLYQLWFQGELNCSLDDIAAEVSILLKLGAQDTLSA